MASAPALLTAAPRMLPNARPVQTIPQWMPQRMCYVNWAGIKTDCSQTHDYRNKQPKVGRNQATAHAWLQPIRSCDKMARQRRRYRHIGPRRQPARQFRHSGGNASSGDRKSDIQFRRPRPCLRTVRDDAGRRRQAASVRQRSHDRPLHSRPSTLVATAQAARTRCRQATGTSMGASPPRHRHRRLRDHADQMASGPRPSARAHRPPPLCAPTGLRSLAAAVGCAHLASSCTAPQRARSCTAVAPGSFARRPGNRRLADATLA